MLWRLRAKDYAVAKGEPNKSAMRALMATSPRPAAPGLLGYDENAAPVGWISIAPRAEFVRLQTSRVLKPLDETEDLATVWSVSCFLIAKMHRGRGYAAELLRSAVDYATAHGARSVEGYPIDPKKPRYPAAYAWTGFVGAFRAAGFEEVARRSETRPIMRRAVER